MWGVLQPGGQANLSLEPLGPQARGQLGVKDLERDRTIVFEIVDDEYGGHPTASELAPERVMVCQAACEQSQKVCHSAPESGKGWGPALLA